MEVKRDVGSSRTSVGDLGRDLKEDVVADVSCLCHCVCEDCWREV